jgi:hypothetical protein
MALTQFRFSHEGFLLPTSPSGVWVVPTANREGETCDRRPGRTRFPPPSSVPLTTTAENDQEGDPMRLVSCVSSLQTAQPKQLYGGHPTSMTTKPRILH